MLTPHGNHNRLELQDISGLRPMNVLKHRNVCFSSVLVPLHLYVFRLLGQPHMVPHFYHLLVKP
ncbi:hypothetical protein CPC08DRAFT_201788 [Agrocybe pediades]|nr:hypothetical protein CPC08DRAFT_201788 [Agrocybe pediades]